MTINDYYDWVVLGDHPGALLSANIMAKMGFSTLVLPLHPSLQVHTSSSDQLFDPEPNFILGLGRVDRSIGLLSECHNYLGYSVSELNLIKTGSESFPQVITPQTRLNLGLDNEGIKHELKREWGEEIAKKTSLLPALRFSQPLALSFWRSFPDYTVLPISKRPTTRLFGKFRTPKHSSTMSIANRFFLKQRSNAKGNSKKWFSLDRSISDLSEAAIEKDLVEICSGIYYGVNGNDTWNPNVLNFLHSLALARTGASFKGGMSAYRQFLRTSGRRLGVQIPEDVECKRLFIEKGKLIGVQVKSRGRMVGVGGGILGCSLDHARKIVYLSGKKVLKKLIQTPTPKGWRLTLALTVNSEAIPHGMSPRAIWKQKDAPSVEIEVTEPKEYDVKKTNEKIVFIRTEVPFTKETLTLDYQKKITARLYQLLTQIFPFLEYHVVNIFPDFKKDPEVLEKEFYEAYPFKKLEDISDNLRVSSGKGVGSFSGIEGLYLASNESFPQLGSFGGTIAGIEALSWYAEMRKSVGDHRFNRFWGFLD